ncbi:TonB-dependent receptor [Leeuwenhoekiella parthenopeia]|uniref:TonB-dependent receptor n=1 Tax=Leeuwenhoekiella parthenopeia TaxID=2890320 RepID=A0ABS8GP71_9FLAO|nr:TonB-dependent receptor [Leeuwenhoekiella parthenopeia]MCC4211791.1 TonB-dependent receptor [Leeuwenhoekiella parthenopeia]
MKKLLSFLFYIFFLQVLEAQTTTETIYVTSKEKSLIDIFEFIESQVDVSFFYADSWIEGVTVTGDFEGTLSNVLSGLLEDTPLNFFITQNRRVIITKNNLIYSSLPEGFFSKPQDSIQVLALEQSQEDPFFYDRQKIEQTRFVNTVRIGKEVLGRAKQSYTISGIAINQDSGNPLQDLSISVEDLGIGTSTDENGYYEITLPPGEHTLKSSLLDMQTLVQKVIVYSGGELNLSLSENYQLLGEVLLNTGANANVEDATAGSEKYNVEENKNIPLVLGERDVLKIAATLPGISTVGESASGYNVRGSRSDQNLFLLDGGVIYNPSHFFGIFSALNPFTTESVEIFKGHMPARFGGRLASVFDIESKTPSKSDFNGEASIGPVTSSLMLQIPVVKVKSGLMIGGRVTYSDYILRALDEESLDNSSASFYDIFLRYDHKIGQYGRFKASAYTSQDRFSINSDSVYGYQNIMANASYDFRLSEKSRGHALISHSRYSFEIDYDSQNQNAFAQDYAIAESALRFDLVSKLNERHNLRYGLNTKLYSINPGTLDPLNESNLQPITLDNKKGLESAIYFSDEFEINEKLLVEAGLRLSMFNLVGPTKQRVYEEGLPKSDETVSDVIEYNSGEFAQAYGGPELRISSRYLLSRSFSVKASYNNTLQYIHTLSNNTAASPIDIYTLSDSNIEPQRSQQVSLGFYKNFDAPLLELSFEGYYKTSTNLIDFKTGASLFFNEFIETEALQGNGRSYGVEFLIRKEAGDFNGYLSYTYSRSLQQFDSPYGENRINEGEYFPTNYDKPHDVSLIANYRLTKRFSFSGNIVYQTGRPVTFPIGKYIYNNAEYVVYSDRNQFRIPDYYRLDLGVNIEGNHKKNKLGHSFVNISVYNVLGRNNPYAVYFVTDAGEVKAYQSSIFSVPVPTITYNFKF